MKKQISYRIVSLVFSVLILCFAIAFYAIGWEEPVVPPPGGNVPAPLNTGPDGQQKLGALNIAGGFESEGVTLLATLGGRVDIGTRDQQAKLHIDGIAGTDGIMFPDGTLQTTAAVAGGGGAFGSWTNLDSNSNNLGLVGNAVYKATSDGFVTAYITPETSAIMYGYTDGNNPPMTIRFVAASAHAAIGNPKGSFTMPVRKDDFWRITGNPDAGSIYWIPRGSGVCILMTTGSYVSLTMWRQQAFRTWDNVYVTVTVRENIASSNSVVGATVQGTWNPVGEQGCTTSGTTNSSGQVTLNNLWVPRSQTTTFTVNKITIGGVEYFPGDLVGTLSGTM